VHLVVKVSDGCFQKGNHAMHPLVRLDWHLLDLAIH
jgi:hypothetical protein